VIPLVEEATTEEGGDYIRFAAQVVQRPGFSGGVGKTSGVFSTTAK